MDQRPLADIDADLVKYRAALDELLLGSRRTTLKHGDREVQFSDSPTATRDLKLKIRQLEIERARATGSPLPHRPFSPRGIS